MNELSGCTEVAPQYVRGAYRGALVDERSKQRLEFAGDDPFIVFALDDRDVEWGPGKKPDGVLIVDVDGVTWVCFIEMKGSANTERAFTQLEAGARHFCPSSRSGGVRTHGDEHHDAWSSGRDLLAVMPGRDHRTIGVFVTFRSLAQAPPRPPKLIAGRPVPTRAVQVSKKKPNWAEIDPRTLLRKAGAL